LENQTALEGLTKVFGFHNRILLSKLNLTIRKNHFSSDLNTVITFRLEYKSLLVSVGSYFKLSYRWNIPNLKIQNPKCPIIRNFCVQTWCHKWKIPHMTSSWVAVETQGALIILYEFCVWTWLPFSSCIIMYMQTFQNLKNIWNAFDNSSQTFQIRDTQPVVHILYSCILYIEMKTSCGEKVLLIINSTQIVI
jgi:hypothetical protein